MAPSPSASWELPQLDTSSSTTGFDEQELEALKQPLGFDTYEFTTDGLFDGAKQLPSFVDSTAELEYNYSAEADFSDQIGGNGYPLEMELDGDQPMRTEAEISFSRPQPEGCWDVNCMKCNGLTQHTIPSQGLASPPFPESIFRGPIAEQTPMVCKKRGLVLKSHDSSSARSASPEKMIIDRAPQSKAATPTGQKCTHEGCGKVIGREADMRRHLETAHGPDLFRCGHQGCQERFKRKDKARLHCRKKHPDAKEEDLIVPLADQKAVAAP